MHAEINTLVVINLLYEKVEKEIKKEIDLQKKLEELNIKIKLYNI